MASVTLGWFHVVVLLGAVQGLLLTIALATKRGNRTAHRLLAAALLSFTLALASAVYHAADLMPTYPHFFGIGFPLPLLFGPLVYLYAVHAADRDRRFGRWDWLHFLPFLLVVLFGLPIYLMSGAQKIAFLESLERGVAPPTLLTVTGPLKFLSGVGYTLVTVAFLRRHRERIKESYSYTERVNLQWLLWLVGGAAAIWLLALGSTVAESAGMARVGIGDDLVSVALAILVGAIGYMGLRQPEIFRFEASDRLTRAQHTSATPEEERTTAAAPAPRYERSGLSERDAARLRETLLAVMDNQEPWRDSELTLAQLADELKTTPHKLSEVLNSEIGVTFYDFVNGYRVREVQRRIAAGEAGTLKLLSLALDAGFASKSTFNQVFKKHTNQTPSDFRQALGV